MGMDTWIWLILCIVFIVAEAATTALISVWFAVGAAAALVASIFTNSPVVQFVVFALVSAVTLAVMVPTLVKRRASKKPPVTIGSQLTVGKRGVVLKATPAAGDTIVEIQFERAGIKKTMANYAPLTLLED